VKVVATDADDASSSAEASVELKPCPSETPTQQPKRPESLKRRYFESEPIFGPKRDAGKWYRRFAVGQFETGVCEKRCEDGLSFEHGKGRADASARSGPERHIGAAVAAGLRLRREARRIEFERVLPQELMAVDSVNRNDDGCAFVELDAVKCDGSDRSAHQNGHRRIEPHGFLEHGIQQLELADVVKASFFAGRHGDDVPPQT